MEVKTRKQFADLGSKQRIYIDWVAGGGTLVDDDGKLESITSIELAERLGVTRQALHKYRKLTYFWDLVNERRTLLYGRDRMSMLYKAMMGKALKGDTAAMKLMMQQARMLEAEKQDVSVSGTVAIAVINYGSGEVSTNSLGGDGKKVVGAGEKPQLNQVPVPHYIASPTEISTPQRANAANTANGGYKPLKVAKPKQPRKQNPPKQQPLEGRSEVVLEDGKAPIRLKSAQ